VGIIFFSGRYFYLTFLDKKESQIYAFGQSPSEMGLGGGVSRDRPAAAEMFKLRLVFADVTAQD